MEIRMLHQYWFQPIAHHLPSRQMIFPSLLFLKIFPFPIIEYWCHLHFDWFTGWCEIRNSAKNLPIICKVDNKQFLFFIVSKLTSIFLVLFVRNIRKMLLDLFVPLIDRNFVLRVIPTWNTYDQFWFLFSCLFLLGQTLVRCIIPNHLVTTNYVRFEERLLK